MPRSRPALRAPHSADHLSWMGGRGWDKGEMMWRMAARGAVAVVAKAGALRGKRPVFRLLLFSSEFWKERKKEFGGQERGCET